MSKKILVDVPDNRAWERDSTMLIVFGKDGKQIEDYDLVTGLKIENIDGNLFMTIDEEFVPVGSWRFDGIWIEFPKDKAPIFHTEKIYGNSEEEKTKNFNVLERPWDYEGSKIPYVSFKERSERISICRSCPMFNHENGICEIDGQNTLLTTKIANYSCPDNKWSISKDADEEYVPAPTSQYEFEAEFEKFLEEN